MPKVRSHVSSDAIPCWDSKLGRADFPFCQEFWLQNSPSCEKLTTKSCTSIATAPTSTTFAMALIQTDSSAYTIKPQASAPEIDTSDWPLLLKNYSDCMQLSHSSLQHVC